MDAAEDDDTVKLPGKTDDDEGAFLKDALVWSDAVALRCAP